MAFNPNSYVVTEPKSIPVILLLDTSTSMSGNKIEALNKSVKIMINEFKKAETKETFIKLAIITFGNGGVKLHTPLTEASKVDFKPLTAGGWTPMGMALKMAKDMIEDKNIILGRDYRPGVVLVSDGQPNDEWEKPLERFINEGRSQKCDRLALAIGDDADKKILNLFIEGCENPLFYADDADEIINAFKKITMSFTQRSSSVNKNKPINIEDELDSGSVSLDDIDDYL